MTAGKKPLLKPWEKIGRTLKHPIPTATEEPAASRIKPVAVPEQPTTIDMKYQPQYILDAIKEYNGKISADLFKAPGFIADMIEYSESRAPYLNFTANSVATFALTAFLASRKYQTDSKILPRLYLFTLSPSGSGKENGRTLNSEVLSKLHLHSAIIGDIASGEGIEDHILTHGAALIQYDEVATLFSALQDRRNSVKAKINKNLLTFYSSTVMIPRPKAKNIQDKNELPKIPAVDFGLVLYGTSVPAVFFDAISKESTIDGLLARCFVFDHQEGRKMNETQNFQDIPEKLIEQAERIYTRPKPTATLELGRAFPNGTPQQTVFKTADAAAALMKIRLSWDNLYNELPPDEIEAESARALFARAAEKTEKLALIFAISRNPEEPQIDTADIRRAEILTFHSIARLLRATKKCGATEFEKEMERMIMILTRNGGKLARSAFLKKSGLPAKQFDSVVNTLCESGVIDKDWVQQEESRQGRHAAIYFLTDRQKKI